MKARKLVYSVITAMAVLMLASCSESITTRRWTEDSKVIRIQREVTFNETDALGGGAYNSVEQASVLRFTGENASLPAWNVPLLAHTLYRDLATGEWVVVAITSSCEVWRARGAPNPPYWEYRLGPQGWRQVPLSPASTGRHRNLLSRYQLELPMGLITLPQKAELDKDIKTLEQMTMTERKYRIVMAETNPGYCS
jgi:hypothetical protein